LRGAKPPLLFILYFFCSLSPLKTAAIESKIGKTATENISQRYDFGCLPVSF
jgi:hypothetical protein